VGANVAVDVIATLIVDANGNGNATLIVSDPVDGRRQPLPTAADTTVMLGWSIELLVFLDRVAAILTKAMGCDRQRGRTRSG
jgi:hypothetical protein